MKAIIAISDTHVGSNFGLCPPPGYTLPDGNVYGQNKFQQSSWVWWEHFWGEFVPSVVKRRPKLKTILVVHNGDVVDGVHHKTTAIMSTSWAAQETAAIQTLKTINQYDGLYMVRGTEAHSDIGAQSEERIAKALGAIPNEIGEYSSYQWWLDVDGVVFQFAHHIGTTSSAAYETSAPMRELVSGLVEAAQWGQKLPQVIVRSHRHRFTPVSIPSLHGRINCVITPGWQLRTPFIERIDRMRMPHIGGVVFLVEDGTCEIREKIYPIPQPQLTQV